MRRPSLVVFGLILGLFSAANAQADDKDACATAAESAQLLQRQGKLMSARDQALVCARPICPPIVKQDCESLYANLELTTPSLVIAVHDDAGHDLPLATVTIDGAAVPMTSGQAIRVDPGTHMLHVKAEKFKDGDQRIVVREGERARPVVITLESTTPAPPKEPPSTTSPPPARPMHPLVWVFGTLSLVSLAGFVVFEIEAVSDAAHYKRTCAPRCTDDQVDTVRTESRLGAISGIAAAAFAGGAVAVWFLDRDKPIKVGFSPNGFNVAGRF